MSVVLHHTAFNVYFKEEKNSLNKQPPHKITIETSCMKCCKHHSDIVYEVTGITIQDCICILKKDVLNWRFIKSLNKISTF